jgi:arylsulfatase A-like enzyme
LVARQLHRSRRLPGLRAARAIAAFAAAALGLAACGGAPARPGRIVLLSMDTVRADRVSGWAADEPTPVLAEIAAGGVRVRRFYAASSYTIPSHMSLFTGLDAAEHGVHEEDARLDPAVPTLALLLWNAGFRTQAFHEGVYVAPRFGFDRGFETYREVGRNALPNQALPEVLAFLRAQGERPYFLFLHTYAAHFPYGGFARYRDAQPERGLPSDAELAEWRRRWPRGRPSETTVAARVPPATHLLCTLYNQFAEARGEMLGCGSNELPPGFAATPHFEDDVAALRRSYDARIASIDGALGAIRATLLELGQWEDTLLVVTSDHGEAFFEHGHYRHDYVPFDEVLRVPLVISWPAGLGGRAGAVLEGLAWHPDLFPTLLGLAGLRAEPRAAALDLGPALRGEATLPDGRAVFPAVLQAAHLPQEPLRRVAVQGDEKWIEGHPRFGDADGLLFDVARDPGERENLRATRPGRAAALRQLAGAYAARLEPRPVARQAGREDPATAAPLPAEEREKLRALGYLE